MVLWHFLLMSGWVLLGYGGVGELCERWGGVVLAAS